MLNADGRPVDPSVLDAMTTAIAHRGPDGHGSYADGPVGLGNRRLAIIDLSHGADQPLRTADGRYALTYNGEVYNFRELRSELEAAGRRFRTRTDSEVVLEAFAHWGPSCVRRFNGMFAFAVWDAHDQRLFVARDRYGIKPLYFARLGGTLLVGSEIKSFLAHPAFKVRVSHAHLLEYFTFQNVFTDGTLFDGVRMLGAGHHMSVRPGAAPLVERYWDFDFTEEETGAAPEELEEELDRLFRAAVERQLVSDVPVGGYLSGGIDSGSITAVAAEHLPHLATFTGGFDMTSTGGLDVGPDERVKAEAMSYRFKTEHYEAVLKAGDMERCLPSLVWHLEDLRVGQSYPNFYVARLASKFVRVVLSGAGGDELFAGYPWRYYRAVVNDDLDHYVEKYYRFWHRLVPNRHMPDLFAPAVWSDVRDLRTIDVFRAALPNGEPPTSPEEYVNHSLHLEAKTFLHGLLVVDDKLSMAHSLESRVPFLDDDLVAFAQRLPVRHKLRDLRHVVELNENEPGEKTERYFAKTRDGKLALRRVLGRYVPPDISEGIKRGFSGPDASWFRGESMDYVRRIVFNDDAAMYEYLRPELVRTLVDDHLEGRANRRLLLWSLLNFEQWCRIFVGGERPVAH